MKWIWFWNPLYISAQPPSLPVDENEPLYIYSGRINLFAERGLFGGVRQRPLGSERWIEGFSPHTVPGSIKKPISNHCSLNYRHYSSVNTSQLILNNIGFLLNQRHLIEFVCLTGKVNFSLRFFRRSTYRRIMVWGYKNFLLALFLLYS